MKTKDEWDAILSTPDARMRDRAVADAARVYLALIPAKVSTTALLHTLYPWPNTATTERLARCLGRLAIGELADCAERGKPKAHPFKRGQVVRPWLWHAPTERNLEAAILPTEAGDAAILPTEAGDAAILPTEAGDAAIRAAVEWASTIDGRLAREGITIGVRRLAAEFVGRGLASPAILELFKHDPED